VPAPATTRRTRSTVRTALGDGNGRLATTIASRIIDDVARRGWTVGDVIGTEAEMLDRYGCSRAVLREAIRLIEHHHVARMRQGPGGGLVVTEPDVNAIIDAAVVYLLRCDARLDEVFEARLIVEDMAMAVAPSRLDEADITRIRQLIAEEEAGLHTDARALHRLIAASSKNPALELFVDLLSRLTLFYFSQRNEITEPTLGAAGHAHERIAEAVVAGDPGTARRRMEAHLRAEADFIRQRRGTRQELNPLLAIHDWQGSKRGQATAREIFGRIVEERIPPGTLLGFEADLMQTYGAGRAGVREAIRILEHHQIAVMRRGQYGGLFVVEADVGAMCELVALHLERNAVEPEHLAELRIGIELAICDLVIDRWTSESEARLHDALLAEKAATKDQMVEVVHDLHAVMAALSGNRVLELLARTLIRLSRAHRGRGPTRLTKAMREEIHGTHSGIVDALVSGDRDVARTRLRAHLTNLATDPGLR
jgi:DNA-binding FadR family transcriptional regulator